MSDMLTPANPDDGHDCNDHVELEWWDYDKETLAEFFWVECPVCGMSGSTVSCHPAFPPPIDAVFYRNRNPW